MNDLFGFDPKIELKMSTDWLDLNKHNVSTIRLLNDMFNNNVPTIFNYDKNELDDWFHIPYNTYHTNHMLNVIFLICFLSFIIYLYMNIIFLTIILQTVLTLLSFLLKTNQKELLLNVTMEKNFLEIRKK